jgi:microcystin-dependent protein
LPLLGTHFGPVDANLAQLRPESIGTTGNGDAHENMQPFAVVQFMIATTYFATFPTNTILAYGGATAPTNWNVCDGTSGTMDLRGRVLLHRGTGFGLTTRMFGAFGGVATVTLGPGELSAHSHGMQGSSSSGTSVTPDGNVVCHSLLGTSTPDTFLQTSSISPAGSGQAHNNMAPSIALSYIVATSSTVPPSGAISHVVAQLLTADPSGGEMLCAGQLLNATIRPDLAAVFAGSPFAASVPDVRGRFLVGANVSSAIGTLLGSVFESLSLNQIPSHNHHLNAATSVIDLLPGVGLSGKALRGLSNVVSLPAYLATSTASLTMAAEAILESGLGMAHENRHPFVRMDTVLHCDERCSTNLVVSGCGCDLQNGYCNVVVSANETLTPTSTVDSYLIVLSTGTMVVDVFGLCVLQVSKSASLAGKVIRWDYCIVM